ncbi:unnamed protein product [Musa acuminata var. zebrina]
MDYLEEWQGRSTHLYPASRLLPVPAWKKDADSGDRCTRPLIYLLLLLECFCSGDAWIPNGTCQNQTSGGFQTDTFLGLKIMSGCKALSFLHRQTDKKRNRGGV